MPSNTTRNTVLRQWELLKQLPSKGPGKTASDLAKALQESGFSVSKRQVERDLQELFEVFPIECNDRSTPYGWHWMAGAAVDLPGLTLAEALSMRVIEDTLKPLLPKSVLEALGPRFKQAQGKLDALQSTNRTARWAKKVRTVAAGFPLVPPKIDSAALESLQESLLADEQVDVSYRSVGEGKAQKLRLHPLGLVQKGPVTYLIATAFSYEDPRLYAVHRISRAERTYEPSRRPSGFALDAYLESGALQFDSRGLIHLKARITEDLAVILAETPLVTDQELKASKGAFTLSARVPNSQLLRFWLLSQGERVEVIEPATLRDELAHEIGQMASHYRRPT